MLERGCFAHARRKFFELADVASTALLAGVAALEMDGTCRTNQSCPTINADRWRDELVKLIGLPIGRGREGHILVRAPTMQSTSEID